MRIVLVFSPLIAMLPDVGPPTRYTDFKENKVRHGGCSA
jgi:hypothetical protein